MRVLIDPGTGATALLFTDNEDRQQMIDNLTSMPDDLLVYCMFPAEHAPDHEQEVFATYVRQVADLLPD